MIDAGKVGRFAQEYYAQFVNGNRVSVAKDLCCLDNHSMAGSNAITAELMTKLDSSDQQVLIQLLTLQAN